MHCHAHKQLYSLLLQGYPTLVTTGTCEAITKVEIWLLLGALHRQHLVLQRWTTFLLVVPLPPWAFEFSGKQNKLCKNGLNRPIVTNLNPKSNLIIPSPFQKPLPFTQSYLKVPLDCFKTAISRDSHLAPVTTQQLLASCWHFEVPPQRNEHWAYWSDFFPSGQTWY